VNPLSVETGTSMQQLFAEWNVHVQRWLQNFVFLRLPRSVNRPATMLVSAAWHGFFPGYYLAFLSAPLMSETTRVFMAACGALAERALGWRPRPPPAQGGDGCQFPEGRAWLLPRVAWGGLRWLATFTAFSYMLTPFLTLRWERTVTVWAYMGFAGHLVPLALPALAAGVSALAGRRRAAAAAGPAGTEAPGAGAEGAGAEGAAAERKGQGAGAKKKA